MGKAKAKMNKAEKFIFGLVMDNPHIAWWEMKEKVAMKLGLNMDGFKFQDVEEPKLPPEYTRAMDAVLWARRSIRRKREASA